MASPENILEVWTKEPGEEQDYDITYAKYLTSMGESLTGHTVVASATAGITVDSYSITNGIAKVWLSGGTDDQDYLVLVQVTTAGGRKKFGYVLIQVRQTEAP